MSKRKSGPQNPTKGFLTMTEAASRIGVDRTMLYYASGLVKAKTVIPKLKAGSQMHGAPRMVRISDLLEWKAKYDKNRRIQYKKKKAEARRAQRAEQAEAKA